MFGKNRYNRLSAIGLGIIVVALVISHCDSDDDMQPDSIPVGALLPFSGEQAAVGLNVEQAISLAISDVNRAGGVAGRPLRLVSRDSNSGSRKGYEQARKLLYEQRIRYLIGPEENGLAKQLVPDVKTLDVLNILPGFAAPTIEQTGSQGAWIRLAPTPSAMGCAIAYNATAAGVETAMTITMADDYQTLLAAAFNSHFAELGGRLLGSLTIRPEQASYIDQLDTLMALDPDVIVLMAYPPTASNLAKDWLISAQQGVWYLAPTLYTDVFLDAVPANALEGFTAFSPSLSLNSECNIEAKNSPEAVSCTRGNIQRFSEHYADAWGRDEPLPASLFYYDAAVLLALGLERAVHLGQTAPSPAEIREHIKYVAEKPGVTIGWDRIADGLERLAAGGDIAYSGAAAEYAFEVSSQGVNYGVADHLVMDAWSIRDNEFVLSGSIGAYCMESNQE